MNMIRADSYFFISCDSPYNSKGLAEDFIKERQHYDIIVPVHSNEKIEPLFGVYSYKVLSFLKKQIDVQDYKLMNLLKQCNTLYYDVPNKFFSDNPLLFKNINLPSDVN
jgi:molybdopterin-guanine dinucleotide biosynthesis protein A